MTQPIDKYGSADEMYSALANGEMTVTTLYQSIGSDIDADILIPESFGYKDAERDFDDLSSGEAYALGMAKMWHIVGDG